ncbi:hypothetical protein N7535_006288 [Penicillium sp. DV-2018c]|nr:hypothetical protein N7535_006288 [Penicillium sp. DV-2018c]
MYSMSFIAKWLTYGVAFHIWCNFVLIRFLDDNDDVDDNDLSTPTTNLDQVAAGQTSGQSGEAPVEELVDGNALFIPLAWSRLQEGELYTTSDPEWQEFVKLSKDQKKLQQLRDELAAIVLKIASPRISHLIGASPSIFGFWLVHQFPNRAPPGYVLSGVEITSDGASWVTKPMDPEIGDRLQIFMKPVHVALAIRDAYLLLFLRQLDRFRNPAGEPRDAFDAVNMQSSMSGNKREGWILQQDQSQLQKPLSDGLKENMPVHRENSNYHPSPLISLLQRLPLPDLGPGSELHLASEYFKLRLGLERARTPRSAPRGVFFMAGPVGLKGANGFCRFEVRGEYDPAKPGWRQVDIVVKDINLKQPRAVGSR